MLEYLNQPADLDRHRTWWKLIGVMTMALLLRIAAFSGYSNGDDTIYLGLALQVADGNFEIPTNHWGARIGVYFPVAASFKVFGTSLASVAVVPLFFSLSSVLLAFLIGRVVYGDDQVGLLGATFLAFFPLDVIMASLLYPEMGIESLTSASLLALLVAEKKQSSFLYFAAGFALGLAYLHKITAMYLLLPFAIYLAYCRRWQRGYAFAVTGLLAVIVVESIVFLFMHEEPFHRLHAIVSVAAGDPKAYWYTNPRPGGKLLSPLVSFVTQEEYGLFYIFIFWAAGRLLLLPDKPSRPLLLFFISVGLYTWWGPVSFKGYQNAEPWPRYSTIVSVPAMLLLARWCLLCLSKRWRYWVVGLLLLSSLACIHLSAARTHTSIGKKLRAFQQDHPDHTLVLDGSSYMFLFVENGLRAPSNVELISRGARIPKSISPSLIVHEDERSLSDCFVVRSFPVSEPVFDTWRQVDLVVREQRWFADRMRSRGGVFASLAEKLSPRTGYTIYYANPVDRPAPSPGH